MSLVYVGCEILVAIGAIFGNSLVVIAFRRERRLRRRTNYYIVSLAVADLLVGLLGIPCALLAYSGYPKQLHACLFTVSLLVVLCTISIFSLVAVSVDRYWAILYPMGYSRNVRTKTAICIICFCWVAGAIVGFLPLLGWNAGRSGQELKECSFTKVMDYNFLVFIYFATIIFPGLLMAAFYAHIYSVVVKQLKQMVTVNGTSGGSGAMLRVLGAARKREVKATQNLSIIVLFFMLCWFPLYTINFIQAYHRDISIPSYLMESCIILTHLNSAGNPLLYAYHLRDFRAALRAVLFGEAPEVDKKVMGRENSAYLHDLADRRKSSQPNNWNGKPAKDQNLNLTAVPAIQNQLADIQETSKTESSVKMTPLETDCEPAPKSNNCFFKFPIDRSLKRLKDKEHPKISNLTPSEKQPYRYSELEESNASMGNELNSTKIVDEVCQEIPIIKNDISEKESEEELSACKVTCPELKNISVVDPNEDSDDNSKGKRRSTESSESNSKSSINTYSKNSSKDVVEKEMNEVKEENCEADTDDNDNDDDDDDDWNGKTGNEITTGIFNDCFVAEEDSIDEVDNSILSNDKVTNIPEESYCDQINPKFSKSDDENLEIAKLEKVECSDEETVQNGGKTSMSKDSVMIDSISSEQSKNKTSYVIDSEDLDNVKCTNSPKKENGSSNYFSAILVTDASPNNLSPINRQSLRDDTSNLGSRSRTISLTSDMTTFTISNTSLNSGETTST